MFIVKSLFANFPIDMLLCFKDAKVANPTLPYPTLPYPTSPPPPASTITSTGPSTFVDHTRVWPVFETGRAHWLQRHPEAGSSLHAKLGVQSLSCTRHAQLSTPNPQLSIRGCPVEGDDHGTPYHERGRDETTFPSTCCSVPRTPRSPEP